MPADSKGTLLVPDAKYVLIKLVTGESTSSSAVGDVVFSHGYAPSNQVVVTCILWQPCQNICMRSVSLFDIALK
jgi:hypothetical protein